MKSKVSGSDKMKCGVCGEPLGRDSKGEIKCKTCEHFFRVSSEIKKCSICNKLFGTYRKIDQIALSFCGSKNYFINRRLWEELCPKCRIKAYEESRSFKRTGKHLFPICYTTKELINYLMKTRATTFKDFERESIPREFIEFCAK